jgi:hypothetical protein
MDRSCHIPWRQTDQPTRLQRIVQLGQHLTGAGTNCSRERGVVGAAEEGGQVAAEPVDGGEQGVDLAAVYETACSWQVTVTGCGWFQADGSPVPGSIRGRSGQHGLVPRAVAVGQRPGQERPGPRSGLPRAPPHLERPPSACSPPDWCAEVVVPRKPDPQLTGPAPSSEAVQPASRRTHCNS